MTGICTILRLPYVLLAIVLVFSRQAKADLLIQDDFNSEALGANHTSFTNWIVTAGSVDILGPGLFDPLPGNGNYVDLAGTTNQGGTLASKQVFAPGTYDLSFRGAGSQQGDTNFVTISLGDATTSGFVPSSLPFTLFSYHFTTHVAGRLIFSNAGNDNFGALLDDVTLSGPAPVPEPTSFVLAGLGGIGLVAGAIRRRHTRQSAV